MEVDREVERTGPRPFPEDSGLTACAFCGGNGDLLLSHIVPKFVWDWQRRTSPTGHIRAGYAPNRRIQDGWKCRLLCRDCELRFSQWERPFAERIFVPTTKREVGLTYGSWMSRFAVSVSWRVLRAFRDAGNLEEWPPLWKAKADAALDKWRGFLAGEFSNPGRFEQHMIPLDMIERTTWQNVPANLNRYLLRAVEVDIPRGERSALVYTKMGRVLLVGLIEEAQPNRWKGTRVAMKEGRFGAAEYGLPTELGEYMLHRAERARELWRTISNRQQQKISDTIRADLDRAASSETFEALQRDVEMFGDAAFKPKK